MKYPASPSDWFKQNVKQSWRATSDHALMLAQEPLKKVHTICIRVALSTWKNRPKGYTTNPENHTRLFNRSLQRWIHWTIETGRKKSHKSGYHVEEMNTSVANVVAVWLLLLKASLKCGAGICCQKRKLFFCISSTFPLDFPLSRHFPLKARWC